MMNEPAPTIRQFRFPEDYPAVLALWSNAGPGINVARSDAPDEIAKKLERDPDLFLVAELNSEIVGSVLGGYDGRRGLVYHLAVAEACRKHGLGAALMEAVEERLRQKGCLKCYLLVVNGNDAAAQFYEKRGWEAMGVKVYGKELL